MPETPILYCYDTDCPNWKTFLADNLTNTSCNPDSAGLAPPPASQPLTTIQRYYHGIQESAENKGFVLRRCRRPPCPVQPGTARRHYPAERRIGRQPEPGLGPMTNRRHYRNILDVMRRYAGPVGNGKPDFQ